MLTAQAAYQHDTVLARNLPDFEEPLNTTLLGLGVTQILLPELIAGLTLETQILRGYDENPYRVEQHPRGRNRYSVGSYAALRIAASKTTIRVDYRQEVSLGVHRRFLDSLTPSLSFRYSYEGDYRSVGVGAQLALELFENAPC